MSAPGIPEAEPPPPTVEALQAALPQFEILGLIGVGGMGAVYKAKQPKLDRLVAIKLLPPALTSGSDFEQRFQSEARAMAKMMHNRIVTVHDFGETEQGWLYIVMEYVEGHDLNDLIAKKELSPDHALAVATQICDALAYAHERHLVHQDIKPANIMLDVNGQVKVADFGLAKMVASGENSTTDESVGIVMGSPDYVAPERLETGNEGDHRADIYSLGVTIYEMLTGATPRGNDTPPSQVVPGLDPRIDAVVARAITPDREQRYQQISQLWQDLDQIRTTPAPGGTAIQSPSNYAHNSKRSSGRSVVIIATLAVLAAGLAIFFNGEPDNGTTGTAEPPIPQPPTVESNPTPPETPSSNPTPPAPEKILPTAPAMATEADEPPPDAPEPTSEPNVNTPSEASIAVAEILDRHRQTYERTLAADLNDYYHAALEREILEFEKSGSTTVAQALAAEEDRLSESAGLPLTSELPADAPQRLIELRKIYLDSLQTKRNKLTDQAAQRVSEIDADLRDLQAGYLSTNKTADANEVAEARKNLQDTLPFSTGEVATADPSPAKPGRLHGWGIAPDGEPFDLAIADSYDDFVDVEYHMSHWAAIRKNGEVISNRRRLHGIEGAKSVAMTGPRNYVLYRDGRVECQPGDSRLPADIHNATKISVGISDGIALLDDGSVTAWGNTFSQPDKGPPTGLQDVVDIAITWGSSDNPSSGFALGADGRVTTWGDASNTFPLPGDLPPIKEIEAGWTHLLCLAEDGSVICLPGQKQRPINPPDALPAAVTIRARGIFFAARDTGGTWHAWGHKQFGVVNKINEIGKAHQIAFKANRWHGVFWIEP